MMSRGAMCGSLPCGKNQVSVTSEWRRRLGDAKWGRQVSVAAQAGSRLQKLLLPAVTLVHPARLAVRRRLFVNDMQRRFATTPPQTLNEKIRYKMAFDHRTLLTTLADKVAVRDFVADRVGPGVLTQTYAVLDSPGELRLDELPERFVIKPTHGSCAVIIVDDRAPQDAALLKPLLRSAWRCGMSRVRKEALEFAAFESLAQSWLRNRFLGPLSEPAYRDIPPRLIVEELLEGPEGQIPPDYKFWCFEGKIGFLQVDLGRFSGRTRSLHMPNWQRIDATMKYPAPDRAPPVPDRLEEMLELASSLSHGLDFVRVDLYAMSDRVVFGEMTNYPGAGRLVMTPESVLSELGSAWRPERLYGPAGTSA